MGLAYAKIKHSMAYHRMKTRFENESLSSAPKKWMSKGGGGGSDLILKVGGIRSYFTSSTGGGHKLTKKPTLLIRTPFEILDISQTFNLQM